MIILHKEKGHLIKDVLFLYVTSYTMKQLFRCSLITVIILFAVS
jgi:hypothetical protein